MGILGEVGDGLKDMASGVAKLDTAIVMAPAEIAHWAIGEMFGGGNGELHQIAAELTTLGQKMDELGKAINAELGRLTWHGPASDAFVGHAQARVRELGDVADKLDGLGKSVTSLANVY
jgi:uncharacterized protein YukE